MEEPSSYTVSRSNSIESALRRFKLLLSSTTNTHAGLKAPISVATVPFKTPSAMQPPRFPSGTLISEEKNVDDHLNKYTMTTTQNDARYPTHWRTDENIPPELINGLETKYGVRFFRDQMPERIQRTCMKCWTVQGTLYCLQCSKYFCAPCCCVFHTNGGEAAFHEISMVPENPLNREPWGNDLRVLNQQIPSPAKAHRKSLLSQPKTFTEKKGIFDELNAKPESLINFRPLPDPNFQLPPISKQALSIRKSKKQIYCLTHPTNIPTKCCITCKYLPVCEECLPCGVTTLSVSSAHANHHVMLMSDAAALIVQNNKRIKFLLQNEVSQLRHIQRNLRIVKIGTPSMIRSLKQRIRHAYQEFFRSFSEKYSELHVKLSQLQGKMAEETKILSDENIAFRRYLFHFKIPQLQNLISLGNRNPTAGLNAYVLLKPSFAPLIEGHRFLVDTEGPVRHPWWKLNASDGRDILALAQDKIRNEAKAILAVIAAIALHVKRYLVSTEAQNIHPIGSDVFSTIKKNIYSATHAIKDIEAPSLPFNCPIPHTPEFDKLLPTLKGLMYRKDAFHDWSVVSVLLVDSFLVISSNTSKNDELEIQQQDPSESLRFEYTKTESVIPIIEPSMEINLFSSSKISELTRRALEEASQIYGMSIINGLEIIRRRSDATACSTEQDESRRCHLSSNDPQDNNILTISGYWLLGTDTEGAAEVWISSINDIRTASTLSIGSLRFPVHFPGILPPQARIRHPPLTESHKLAAIQGLGTSSLELDYEIQKQKPIPPYDSSTVNYDELQKSEVDPTPQSIFSSNRDDVGIIAPPLEFSNTPLTISSSPSFSSLSSVTYQQNTQQDLKETINALRNDEQTTGGDVENLEKDVNLMNVVEKQQLKAELHHKATKLAETTSSNSYCISSVIDENQSIEVVSQQRQDRMEETFSQDEESDSWSLISNNPDCPPHSLDCVENESTLVSSQLDKQKLLLSSFDHSHNFFPDSTSASLLSNSSLSSSSSTSKNNDKNNDQNDKCSKSCCNDCFCQNCHQTHVLLKSTLDKLDTVIENQHNTTCSPEKNSFLKTTAINVGTQCVEEDDKTYGNNNSIVNHNVKNDISIPEVLTNDEHVGDNQNLDTSTNKLFSDLDSTTKQSLHDRRDEMYKQENNYYNHPYAHAFTTIQNQKIGDVCSRQPSFRQMQNLVSDIQKEHCVSNSNEISSNIPDSTIHSVELLQGHHDERKDYIPQTFKENTNSSLSNEVTSIDPNVEKQLFRWSLNSKIQVLLKRCDKQKSNIQNKASDDGEEGSTKKRHLVL